MTLEWEHDFDDQWHLKLGTAPVFTTYQGNFSYFYWGWDDPDEDGGDATQVPATGADVVTAASGEPARAGAPDLFG